MTKHDVYIHTVNRLEQDIAPLEANGAATASIAISLKRLADFFCEPEDKTKTSQFYSAIYFATLNALSYIRRQ